MIEKNKIVNGENLFFFDNEIGETTLLFLHGAFINKGYWESQLNFFSQEYRVVAVDLAGHGNSTHNRTDLTIQNFSKDICELIETLSLKNVIIIGHSFGSDVMLETVALNSAQIIGLIEVDHLKNVGLALPTETIQYLVQSLHTDFISTSEQIARQALITDKTNPQLVERLLNDYKTMSKEIGLALLEKGFYYSKRETELLKNLSKKLYLIHVDYSPTNEDCLRKYLGNNYELHTISGTCHYPMVENSDEFNNLLETIISKIQTT